MDDAFRVDSGKKKSKKGQHVDGGIEARIGVFKGNGSDFATSNDL